MRYLMEDPLEGSRELPLELNNLRWSAKDGWVKMEHATTFESGRKVTIHYVYNKNTGVFDDFKFVYPK